MDIEKLESIAAEIEKESHTPSPSHNNLARLLSLFFKELIFGLKEPKADVSVTKSEPIKSEPSENVVSGHGKRGKKTSA